MKANVISFSGAEGSGKDHSAELLIKKLNELGVPSLHMAFSAELYKEVSVLMGQEISFLMNRDVKNNPVKELSLTYCEDYDYISYAKSRIQEIRKTIEPVTEETPLTSREHLQTYSDYVKFFRNPNPLYFAEKELDRVLSSPAKVWVCSDLRHDVELALFSPSVNLLKVRVDLDTQNNNDSALIGIGHPSSWEWRRWKFDVQIQNRNGDLKSLDAAISELASNIRESIDFAKLREDTSPRSFKLTHEF